MKHSKRKKRLPRNIGQRTDAEVMERIFGKRVKRELDKIAEGPKSVANKGSTDHLR